MIVPKWMEYLAAHCLGKPQFRLQKSTLQFNWKPTLWLLKYIACNRISTHLDWSALDPRWNFYAWTGMNELKESWQRWNFLSRYDHYRKADFKCTVREVSDMVKLSSVKVHCPRQLSLVEKIDSVVPFGGVDSRRFTKNNPKWRWSVPS